MKQIQTLLWESICPKFSVRIPDLEELNGLIFQGLPHNTLNNAIETWRKKRLIIAIIMKSLQSQVSFQSGLEIMVYFSGEH